MLAAPRAAAATGWAEVAYTLGAASGLSSLYGMALGARGGGPSLALHAAFAPVAVVGAFVVGALPLYVLLAIADAPVELPSLARAIGRGAAAAGLLLGGLAPLVLLFGVSGETWVAGAVLGWSSLVSSLLVGLAAIRRDVAAAAPARSLALAGFVFAAFSATLALRVAWVALPALGRGGAS
jgi:hypothetical protein